jgi:SAM-dependent methyltransferase
MPKKTKSKKKTTRNGGNDKNKKKHIRIGAKTANGDIDIKQHTVVNITPTENSKYSTSQYYKNPGCISQLKKAGLNNFNDFYDFMFNAYKTRERKTTGWGEGGITNNKIHEKILSLLDGKLTNTAHLDYGCGGGQTGIDIKDRYKVGSTVNIDVENHMSEIAKSDCLYIENKTIDTVEKRIINGTIGIITALQTFHHNNFQDLPFRYRNFDDRIKYVIATLITKLKPGGYMLIKEHDIQNLSEVYPVVFKHMDYSLSELKNTELELKDIKNHINRYHINEKAWYMSYRYLHNIIISCNMELLCSRWEWDINTSSIRTYHSLYRKPA